MAIRIMLDAGHGGSDPGAVFNGRQEKDDNLRLALAVGKLLQAGGVDVSYTRTTDIFETPFQKAEDANRAGVDYFISFHRNSSSEANQYNGVEIFVYDKTGLKYKMAEAILNAMGEVGFRKIGVKVRPGLAVLRYTKMPALLLEIGFINTVSDNNLFDTEFQNIARGIADAILETLGLKPGGQEPGEKIFYRVQTGAFRERENADRMLYKLRGEGYPAFLVYENGLYKVIAASFQNFGNAIALEEELRDAGYSTIIVTK